MKYTVKYRKQKHDAFANVGEIRKETCGKFAGTSVFRDRIFDTYEEAESVRKVYAEKFGEETAKEFLAHAKELKAKGEKFCDCPACSAAQEVLKLIISK